MLKYFLWPHKSVRRTHPREINSKVKQIPPDEKNRKGRDKWSAYI